MDRPIENKGPEVADNKYYVKTSDADVTGK
jgi:hypothetical protein